MRLEARPERHGFVEVAVEVADADDAVGRVGCGSCKLHAARRGLGSLFRPEGLGMRGVNDRVTMRRRLPKNNPQDQADHQRVAQQ